MKLTATDRLVYAGVALCVYTFAVHLLAPVHGGGPWEWLATLLVLLSFLLPLFYAFCFRSSKSASYPRADRNERIAFAVVALPLGILLLGALPHASIWASEKFLIDTARAILKGKVIHPVGYLADFPSRFLSWLVALAYFVYPEPKFAIRIWGVLGGFLTAYLVSETVALLVKRRVPFAWLPPLASIWFFHLATTGDNNWVSLVPVMGAATLYFLIRWRTTGSLGAAALTGWMIGIDLWTLYVPALLGVGVLLVVVGEGLRKHGLSAGKPWYRGPRCLLLLCCATVFTPVAAELMHQSHLLARHEQFLAGKGEAERGVSLLKGYRQTAFGMASSLWSNPNEMAKTGNWSITLERPSAVLAVVGFLALPSLLTLAEAGLVYFLFVFCIAGVILSNPVLSSWRSTVLFPFLYLFAAFGILRLQLTCAKREKVVGWVIAAAAIFFFVANYCQYRKYQHFDTVKDVPSRQSR